MTKKVKYIIIGIIAALIILVSGVAYMYLNGVKAPSSKSEEVVVEISGSTSVVLKQLDEAGLVKNKTMASIFLKLHSYEFKANTYVLNKNMDFETICTILEEAKFDHLLKNKFTVLEGTTIPEYASVIGDKLGLNHDEVLQKWCDKAYLQTLVEKYWFLDESVLEDGLMFPLEGYLAPETYFITDTEPTIESVTEMMLDQTKANLDPLKDKIEAFKMNGKNVTLHEFLALSSIVECESLFEQDRAKIAGVFMHRLEINMKLQSDVTVNYANQVTKVNVTYNDLAVDSKYNTYKYEGLPAGPISSVSLAVMEACLNYEKTDNSFFFAIKGGEVIYTKSYDEHLAKIKEAKEAGLWLED